MGGQKVVGGPLTLGSRTGKLYQTTIASEWKHTVQATWDRVVGGLKQALRLWGARDLPIMLMRAASIPTHATATAVQFPTNSGLIFQTGDLTNDKCLVCTGATLNFTVYPTILTTNHLVPFSGE
jgi:hypothetical protein